MTSGRDDNFQEKHEIDKRTFGPRYAEDEQSVANMTRATRDVIDLFACRLTICIFFQSYNADQASNPVWLTS